MKDLPLQKIYMIMKKVVFICLVAFVTALAVSSCNEKVCPAYSNANTEQVGSFNA